MNGKGSERLHARTQLTHEEMQKKWDEIFKKGKKIAPIVTNHGKALGHDAWYTFACPGCKTQISRLETEKTGCHKCGQKIAWPVVE